jgi:hypothetical protein
LIAVKGVKLGLYFLSGPIWGAIYGWHEEPEPLWKPFYAFVGIFLGPGWTLLGKLEEYYKKTPSPELDFILWVSISFFYWVALDALGFHIVIG